MKISSVIPCLLVPRVTSFMPSPNINTNSINTNSININININTNHHLNGSEQRCRLVDAGPGSRTRLNMAIGGGAAELTSALATLD
eukprot:scaffold8458_cov113-Chaetoceros_neogracile.AAC.1